MGRDRVHPLERASVQCLRVEGRRAGVANRRSMTQRGPLPRFEPRARAQNLRRRDRGP